MLSVAFSVLYLALSATASPFHKLKRWEYEQYYDVQGHRGARGQSVESVIPAFAMALIDGATTLEFDNGLTKDGQVIVWHDEIIDPTKCRDTAPAYEGDSMYPYVGQSVANLTLAQIKTLDCGSERLEGFPLQLEYPGIKLSTLGELFQFVECTGSQVLFNIESKVNPITPGATRTPEEFVKAQLKIFRDYGLIDRITYQSFDWRTIVQAKVIMPELLTAALADDTTVFARKDNLTATSGYSSWLDLNLDDYPGSTVGAKLAEAAASIGADILSPSAIAYNGNTTALDPAFEGYTSFVNQTMVDRAHELGLLVKPWTVNRLNTVAQLEELGVDGIITDYPEVVRDWFEQQGKKVAPKADAQKVMSCVKQHAQFNYQKN